MSARFKDKKIAFRAPVLESTLGLWAFHLAYIIHKKKWGLAKITSKTTVIYSSTMS